MTSDRSRTDQILRALLGWWLGLSALAVVALYLSSGGYDDVRAPWGIVDVVFSRLWLVFPFVAFAGGLAGAADPAAARRSALVLFVITGAGGPLAYLAGEVLAPIAEYRRAVATGDDVSGKYPFGPHTPAALTRLRAAAVDAPAEVYGFSVNRPLDMPPNWITYQVHSPIATMMFALLNAALGLMFGWMTTGLSPPSRRRHVRWVGGLVSAVAYFAVFFGGAQWVRASPENSALLGAWLPLLVPALACAALAMLVTRHDRLPTSPDSGV